MAFQIQVTGEWAGNVAQGWRPAVAGTLNQTGQSDADASTFATESEAATFLERSIVPEIGIDDVDPDYVSMKFRIVEV